MELEPGNLDFSAEDSKRKSLGWKVTCQRDRAWECLWALFSGRWVPSCTQGVAQVQP